MRRPRRLRLVVMAVLAVALGASAFAVSVIMRSRGEDGREALRSALAGRGRVLVVGPAKDGLLSRLDVDQTSLLAASSVPALRAALATSDVSAFVDAMDAADVSGVVLANPRGAPPPTKRSKPPQGSAARRTIEARLRRLEYIPGLRGVHLSEDAALYERHPTVDLVPHHARALAVVARGILAGKQPPRVSSFPEPLRRIRNVEILVLLESDGQPRLWRSARGSSVAQALVTASTVARDRWRERRKAMGGSLRDQLDRLTVHVSLLVEDGHIASTSPSFIDRSVREEHGVGYELKGAWYYLLPRATREVGGGSAARAFRKLFRDNGLDDGAFARPSIRLYRFVALPVGRASSPRRGGASSSDAGDEDAAGWTGDAAADPAGEAAAEAMAEPPGEATAEAAAALLRAEPASEPVAAERLDFVEPAPSAKDALRAVEATPVPIEGATEGPTEGPGRADDDGRGSAASD